MTGYCLRLQAYILTVRHLCVPHVVVSVQGRPNANAAELGDEDAPPVHLPPLLLPPSGEAL